MGRLQDGRSTFSVEASAETLSKTSLSNWKTGTRINLERSLKWAMQLGGHIVSGHVDGLGEIISITPEGDSKRFRFRRQATLPVSLRKRAPLRSMELRSPSMKWMAISSA